jgi:hypothetical protein
MTETISAPTTKVEIISQAAMLCGKQTFNSLASGGAFAQDGEVVFNSLVSAELGSNRWRFAMAFQAMGTLTTLTPSFDGWLYYWNMPSEAIMFFRIYPAVDYVVFGKQVLTKSNQSLTAIYSKTVPVSEWPPAFSWYITYAIASVLGMSVTNSDRMLARIQSGLELWHSRALFADGQNSKARPIQSNPYVDVRSQFRNRGR